MSSLIKKNSNDRNYLPTTFSGLVDSVFQNNLSRFFDDNFWGTDKGLSDQIPVNIKETDKNYEVDFVAPGLKKEDFKINVNGDMLTVSFEHTEDNKDENKDRGWLRQEYRKQSFSRSFTLDGNVDVDKIDASYNDGVLHLSVPKKDKPQQNSKSIIVK